jgi:hypothetical protein
MCSRETSYPVLNVMPTPQHLQLLSLKALRASAVEQRSLRLAASQIVLTMMPWSYCFKGLLLLLEVNALLVMIWRAELVSA